MTHIENHRTIPLRYVGTAASLLCGIVLFLIAGRDCMAQTAGRHDTRQSAVEAYGRLRIVVISCESEPADVAAIEASIEAQLADLDVEPVFIRDVELPTDDASLDRLAEQLMTSHGARAAFIVSPRSNQSLRILLSVDGRNASMARTVDVAMGVPLHEAFAVIIRSTTVSILDQEQRKADERARDLDQTRPIQEAKRPSPSKERPEKSAKTSGEGSGGLFFDSGVALEFIARDTGVTPGLALGLGWRFAEHWQIQLGSVLFSTTSASLRDTRVMIKRYPFYWGAGYYMRLGRFVAGGGGGMRLDFIREQISTMNPNISLGTNYSDSLDTHLSVYITGRAAWWISRFLCVHLDMGAAFMLKRTGYGIKTADGEQVLMELRPVQMLMVAGVQIHFF